MSCVSGDLNGNFRKKITFFFTFDLRTERKIQL